MGLMIAHISFRQYSNARCWLLTAHRCTISKNCPWIRRHTMRKCLGAASALDVACSLWLTEGHPVASRKAKLWCCHDLKFHRRHMIPWAALRTSFVCVCACVCVCVCVVFFLFIYFLKYFFIFISIYSLYRGIHCANSQYPSTVHWLDRPHCLSISAPPRPT
jgi:hypothetical protein